MTEERKEKTNTERNDMAVLISEEIDWLGDYAQDVVAPLGGDVTPILDRIDVLREALLGDPDNRPPADSGSDEGFNTGIPKGETGISDPPSDDYDDDEEEDPELETHKFVSDRVGDCLECGENESEGDHA